MHRKRHLFHFEYPGDGGGAPPAAPAAEAGAVPPAEPIAPTPAGSDAGLEGPPSPEAAAPAWANDPGFRDAVAEEASAIAEAAIQRYLMAQQQTQAPQQQGPEPPAGYDPASFDPFSDEFGNALAGTLSQMEQRIAMAVQNAVAPLAQQHQQAAEHELNQRVQDVLSDVIATNGEYPIPADDPAAQQQARELTLAIATQLAPGEVQRYGPGPRAVESAMAKAHRQVHGMLAAAGQHAQSTYRNQLTNLGGAPPEPQAGGTGFQQPVSDGDELAVARRYAMRQIGG